MPFTKGHKLNIGNKYRLGKSSWMKGKTHSPETIEKMKHTFIKKGQRLSPDTEFKKGQIPWIKGRIGFNSGEENPFFSKKHNIETLEKMRLAKIGKYDGENHPQWLGGISFAPYSTDWTETLKRAIRERDNYICQMEGCGIHQDELGRKLDVHHIDYDKNNCNPENLITLCNSCHTKTNFNRDYWINYFKND